MSSEVLFPQITRDQAVDDAMRKIGTKREGSELLTSENYAKRISKEAISAFAGQFGICLSREPAVLDDSYPGLLAHYGYSPINEENMQTARDNLAKILEAHKE